MRVTVDCSDVDDPACVQEMRETVHELHATLVCPECWGDEFFDAALLPDDHVICVDCGEVCSSRGTGGRFETEEQTFESENVTAIMPLIQTGGAGE